MSPLERIVPEMQRRAALLPEELNSWVERAEQNIDGLGIHQSQFRALRIMMDEQLAKQDSSLQALAPTLPLQQFSQKHLALVRQIVGLHELWRTFRYIMNQHQDPELKPYLVAADLIAADCYRTCRQAAVGFGVLQESKLREPPLVYLEAARSPATASRGLPVGALDITRNTFDKLQLPIPVVHMPFDYARCLWLYSTLHHEVGHNLDQDLALSPELSEAVEKCLTGKATPAAGRGVWKGWVAETLADTFGVLLGGAGFAHALCSLLYPLIPLSAMVQTGGSHPDDYVRVHLLAALLKQLSVPQLTQAANEVDKLLEAQNKPAGADPYLDECDAIAEVFISQPLAALKNHALRELVPSLATDANNSAALAKFLRTGSYFDQPAEPVSWRLIPPAAELALVSMKTPDPPGLQALEDRTLDYLQSLKVPEFLAGEDNSDWLRELAKRIDWSEGSGDEKENGT